MKPGKLIIINGGSSAGKTSMAKELQEICDEPYFLLGIDLFWFTMPEKEIDLERVTERYYRWCHEKTDEGVEYLRILPGHLLNEIMLARYKSMTAYLDRGLNIVADEVFWNRDWLLEALRVFEPYTCYFVSVFCDDEELTRRELKRGDRYLGWARGSQIYSHKDALCDLRMNNTNMTPLQCAQEIKDFVEKHESPQAARLMREKFLSQP